MFSSPVSPIFVAAYLVWYSWLLWHFAGGSSVRVGLWEWARCGFKSSSTPSTNGLSPGALYFRSIYLPKMQPMGRWFVWIFASLGFLGMVAFAALCVTFILFPKGFAVPSYVVLLSGLSSVFFLSAAVLILATHWRRPIRGKRIAARKRAEILLHFADATTALAWARQKSDVSGWFLPSADFAWVSVLQALAIWCVSIAYPLVLFAAGSSQNHPGGRMLLAFIVAMDIAFNAWLLTGIITQTLPWGGHSLRYTAFQDAVMASDIQDLFDD